RLRQAMQPAEGVAKSGPNSHGGMPSTMLIGSQVDGVSDQVEDEYLLSRVVVEESREIRSEPGFGRKNLVYGRLVGDGGCRFGVRTLFEQVARPFPAIHDEVAVAAGGIAGDHVAVDDRAWPQKPAAHQVADYIPLAHHTPTVS